MMKNTKKIIAVVLALFAVLTALTIPAFASSPHGGDIDGDGAVTTADARYALRHAVSLMYLVGDSFLAGDVDGDGSITASDARLILRKAVGLDNVEQNPVFAKTFYEVAHPLVGTYKPAFTTFPLKYFQKWCCVYTIHDTFRPTLEKLGYSADQINLLAPNHYSKDALAKAISNGILGGTPWPTWLTMDSIEFYVPSLLMDYYYKHPEAGRVYNFYDYYDDVVERCLYYANEEDIYTYEPKIGDILFMSNKTNTYSNGYPTIDHTAQIMEVYEDGTFLCTEGSIIEQYEGDNIAKVRERTYHFNPDVGTWEFDYNEVVIVLTAFRPNL